MSGKTPPRKSAPPASRSERVEGALLGLATGDALGGPLEFMSQEQIRIKHGTVAEMLAGGWLSLRPGQGTDETELMQILVSSILDAKGFDPARTASAYLAWFQKGPIDVPNTVRSTLTQMEIGEPWESAARVAYELSESESDDNSALARNLPLAALLGGDPQALVRAVMAESAITHGDVRAGIYAAAGNLVLASLLDGRSAAEALRSAREILDVGHEGTYDVIPDLDYLKPADLRPTKNGLDTLTIALHFLARTKSFEECLVAIVNMGGDTDTAAAVGGALAGALYGREGIPQRWQNRLRERGAILQAARRLSALEASLREAPEPASLQGQSGIPPRKDREGDRNEPPSSLRRAPIDEPAGPPREAGSDEVLLA